MDRTIPCSSAEGQVLTISAQDATIYTGVPSSGTNSTALTAVENPALKDRVQLFRQ